MDLIYQPSLPVIDFTKEKLKCSSAWPSTRQEVVSALEEYGCFIAIYDKVTLELREAIFGAAEELFDLPIETKLLNTSDTPSNGYVGLHPVIPLYEALSIEDAATIEGVQKFTNVLWPSENRSFSDTIFSYCKVVAELDQMVMKMVAESYGIENHYEKIRGSSSYLLRLIKYRPARESEGNLGIVPHTDKSFTTVLHQHQVKGLEVKTKDGHWIPIEPAPSSFLVMAGDVCTAWTNGRIESPTHQVIVSEKEERYSLGLFNFIRDLLIEVPEELVDEEHPLQFKPFDNYKLLHFFDTDEGKRSESAIRAFCGV